MRVLAPSKIKSLVGVMNEGASSIFFLFLSGLAVTKSEPKIRFCQKWYLPGKLDPTGILFPYPIGNLRIFFEQKKGRKNQDKNTLLRNACLVYRSYQY